MARLDLLMALLGAAAAEDLVALMERLQLVLGLALPVLAGLMVAVVEVVRINKCVLVLLLIMGRRANPAQFA
jgi:hypothetical protein